MQGASATESLLEKINDANLRVLVVWEPILPTDWEPPTTGTLHRIHQPGVSQFWDKNHFIAHEMEQELYGNASGSTLWDFVAVFPKQVLWQKTPPKPVFDSGPVLCAQADLSHQLGMMMGGKK